MSQSETASPDLDRGFFGHPRGLSTLFFTELWERFSYYGMRAILVLYMVKTMQGENPGMDLDDKAAGAIYGLYTGLVYLLSLPGGWVADRVMGQRHAVLVGGIIIAAGHFSMAIPGNTTFFIGLLLIIVGTGLLKPNISAIVGSLYSKDDTRRDAGFSIFYMGINIGALSAPLVCGYLGEEVNWHYGFGAAGIGMVLGLIQYVVGWRHLGEAGKFTGDPVKRAKDRNLLVGVTSVAFLVIVVVGYLIASGKWVPDLSLLASYMTGVIIAAAAGYLSYMAFFSGVTQEERKRVGAIAVLFVAAALFWSGFEQAGTSLTLFTERLTDTSIFGWEMPTAWFQFFNPAFIIIFAPVFAWLWTVLAHRQPSSPVKFSLGLILLGGGFVVMVFASLATGYSGEGSDYNRVGMSWIIITYLLHTWGELCLSPVGLSTMTKLSPERFTGQVMGIWFTASALGNVIAGQIGGLFESLPLAQIFGAVTATTAGVGFVLLLLSPAIRRLMGGIR
ncbi:MAG: peptide MFS transporter [Acidobacteriota bacterium]